jgi:hypothetical protein
MPAMLRPDPVSTRFARRIGSPEYGIFAKSRSDNPDHARVPVLMCEKNCTRDLAALSNLPLCFL